MDTIKVYTVQAVKWTAMAGSFSAFVCVGLIAMSWLLFQYLVFLMNHLA